jgi:hypothetical protein
MFHVKPRRTDIMTHPKVDHAVTVALEAIHDAAPGLLTMTQAAEKVASDAGVTTSTGRTYLRKAVEAGSLLEITPWSRKFIIDLPGAEAAGLGPFYIAQEWIGSSHEHRKVITTDDSKMRPSSYGPGNTTYVADPAQIREYIQQLSDQKKARQEAELQVYRDEKKAEAKEISRRFPGLQQSLRTLRLLGTEIREHRGRFASMNIRAYLEGPERRKKEVAIEERDTNVTVDAWGDENVAILKSILDAGLVAYIQAQPLIVCKHCDRRILHTIYGREGFWWHVDTSNASCGKDRDTKAEPIEGTDVPRETRE